MNDLLQDLRYAARTLVKNPLFTVAALLTLGIGIGATTAIFSCVNALLIRPVSFEGMDRLVMLWERMPRQGVNRGNVAPANFLDWKSQARSFADLGAYAWWDANLGGDRGGNTPPERLQGFAVSPGFFRLLRVSPDLGRDFRPEEAEPGRDRVVVLSHQLWQRRFGGNPALLGQTVRIDGQPLTVVGVMPQRFDFPFQAALWTPLMLGSEAARERQAHTLTVIGRLKPGVTIAAARSEMSGIARRLAQQWPESNSGREVTLLPLVRGVVDEFSPTFILLLMGAVSFVLVIACTNVAGLQLARGVSRQKEIAIRAALGASRARVVRQILTENVVLSLAGALLGLLVAVWGLDLMTRAVPLDVRPFIPGFSSIGIDGAVLGFTVAIAVATGLVFGLTPALQASRPDLRETLSEGGRSSRSVAGHRARKLLVAAEIALAVVLLMGAGLLIRGFKRFSDTGHTFEPRGVLAFRVKLSEFKYGAPSQMAAFYQDALARLARLPGVESVAMSSALPWRGGGTLRAVSVEGHAPRSSEEAPQTTYRIVSGNFFRTLRIPHLEGRAFVAGDDSSAARVGIISRMLARRLAPTGSALGLRIRIPAFGADAPWLTVVGVVGDVKLDPFDSGPAPITYVPAAQHPIPSMDFAVRCSGDPSVMVTPVRNTILGIDPDQPIYLALSLERSIADKLSGVRMSAVMMGIFGFVALLLSAVGIYGLVAHSVAQRTHELGVRMALGASSGQVLRLVVGQGLRLAAVGLAIGLVGAFGLSQLLSRLLFGIVRGEPAAFVMLPALLLSVVFLASYLPARGAARVDPMIALRCE